MMSVPTTQDMFLFQQLDPFYDFGNRHELPAHIEQNLAPHIELREYQEHAFSNTLEYLSKENFSKNRQTHLLYHMATGSGKTVMMAGLILHYYSLGYRNFLFFVNQTNIIEKTKANFLDSASAKYLFLPSQLRSMACGFPSTRSTTSLPPIRTLSTSVSRLRKNCTWISLIRRKTRSQAMTSRMHRW